MSNVTTEFPEDPDDLAAWIAGQRDPEFINGGLLLIERFIRQAARRKAFRFGLPADEFADEMFSVIGLELVQGKFDPSRGYCFTSWLHMRLKALAIDELRRRKWEPLTGLLGGDDSPQKGVIDDVEDPGSDPLGKSLAAVSGEPFSADDLARIERWPPIERLLVLALMGWEHRVPDDDWNRWRRAAGLPAPFPPVEVVLCDNVHRRVGILDQLLDRDVAQFWVRKQLRLLELDAGWNWMRAAAPLTEPWEATEVARVASWLPLVRIVLLAISSLWTRLPQWQRWSDWQKESGIGAEVPVLLLVRKVLLSERLDTLQGRLPKRLCADVANLWHSELGQLDGLGRWPFPPREC